MDIEKYYKSLLTPTSGICNKYSVNGRELRKSRRPNTLFDPDTMFIREKINMERLNNEYEDEYEDENDELYLTGEELYENEGNSKLEDYSLFKRKNRDVSSLVEDERFLEV